MHAFATPSDICADTFDDCAPSDPTGFNPMDITLNSISDVGHPHFPGWEWVALLLVCATIVANIHGTLDPRTFRIPRIRHTVTRVVKTEG